VWLVVCISRDVKTSVISTIVVEGHPYLMKSASGHFKKQNAQGCYGTQTKPPFGLMLACFQVNITNSSRLREMKAKLDNIKNTCSCHQH
jgi:hypothetical protein